MNEFLQNVLMLALPLLAGLLAVILVAEARVRWEWFKKEQPNWSSALKTAVSLAIQAAEQAKLADLIEDKKEYAIGVVQDYLDANDIELDVSLIAAAIEAEIRKLKEEGKL